MTELHDYKYYTNLGISETNNGNFEEAIENFNKAINLNPTYSLAHFSKAVAYHNLNKLEEAYENYSKAIVVYPQMVDAYFNRAQTILSNENSDDEDLKKALQDLETAIELDTKFVDAYYYAAVIKKKLQDYRGALIYLDKAIEIEPQAVHSRALKKLIQQKYLK